MKIRFLTVDSVLKIHARAIADYGGTPEILSENLLRSAIEAPKLAYQYSTASLYDLAAIYGYSICKNHAFLDGNKRTALISMLAFLQANRIKIKLTTEEAINIMLDLAGDRLDKQQLAQLLQAATIK